MRTLMALFICLTVFFPVAASASDLDYDTRILAVEAAAQDINAHREFLAAMRHGFGESSMLLWGIPVAEQIPVQPVAVIRLMAATDTGVWNMCPYLVIEDSVPYHLYVDWMERAIYALQGFVMDAPKEEGLRRECLAAIKAAYDARETWRYDCVEQFSPQP